MKINRFSFAVISGVLACAGVTQAQNYTTPFTPKLGLLSDQTYDYIVGESSGEQAYYHILNWAPYERNRSKEEYSGKYEEEIYIAQRFKEYGLPNAQIEHFEGTPVWDGIEGSLWETSPKLQKLADYRDLTAELLQGSSNAEAEAELIWIGRGTEKELQGLDLKGKIVVTEAAASRVQLAVRQAGAIGIVSYYAPRPLVDPIQIPNASIRNDSTIFAFNLSPRDGYVLRDRLLRGEQIKVKAHVTTQHVKSTLSVPSVLIEGTEKGGPEVIVSAHLFEGYVKFGANDNLSGSAATLEAARVLNKLISEGKISRPRYSIRFLWIPEISGTIPWVNAHKDITERAICNLNFDMVGLWLSKSESYFVLHRTPFSRAHFVNDVSEAIFHYIGATNKGFCAVGAGRPEPLKPIYSATGSHDPFYYTVNAYQGSSDHVVFNDFGVQVPGVMFVTWPDNYYHTSGDRPSIVDPTQLRRAVVTAAVSSYAIASADATKALHIAQEVATNASKRLTLEEQTLLRDINDAKVNNINQVLKRSIFNLNAYLTAELIALESTLQLAPTDAHTKAYIAQLKAQLRVNHDQGVRSLTTAAQLRASTLNTKLAAITLTAEEKAADKIRPRATKKAHNEGHGVLNTLEQPTKERRYVRGYKNEIASLTIGGLRSILDIKKALDAQYPDAESLEDIKSYIEKLKAAGLVTY